MSAVITLILFCGCFLFGSFLSFAQNSRTEEPVQFKCYKSIVIQEGDSLWSLAERHIDSESEKRCSEVTGLDVILVEYLPSSIAHVEYICSPIDRDDEREYA